MLPKRNAALDLPPISYTYCPRIVSETDPKACLSLCEEDQTIIWYWLASLSCPLVFNAAPQVNWLFFIWAISYLFRSSSLVKLRPISGGFTGCCVFRAKSRALGGYKQALSVVKLGPRGMIAKERVNFEQVQDILGNNAPTIQEYFNDPLALAAISYCQFYLILG